MRILLVNKFWWIKGGVEEHAYMVKRFFEERGHEVVPFAMASPENDPSPYDRYFPSFVDFRAPGPGQKVRAVWRATAGWETIRNLRQLIAAHPIDAAHVLHPYHQLGTTMLRLLERRGIPVILSLHDYKLGCPSYRLFNDATNQICTICLDRPAGWVWAPAATRCWDGSRLGGVMLSAEAAASHGLRTYRKGAGVVIILNELQRAAVLRAGVEADRIVKIPHFITVEDDVPETRQPYAVCVARLVPEKGVSDAIRGCAKAGVPLKVLGDGRLLGELQDLAASLHADVEFLGYVSQDTVMHHMRTAAVVVLPSIWHEVSALVLTQSMGVHAPVVATATGGTPELVGDGRGFLYPPGDVDQLAEQLRAVIDHPELGRKAAANAAEFARVERTRERWVERMQDAYAMAGLTL